MKLQLLQSVCITAVSVLIAQPALAQVVQVTAVELKPTTNGLEVKLTTADGKPLQVFTSSFRNTFVANILNTQLALPQNASFRGVNPIAGIAAVSVTQQGANSIRVTVVGTSSLPTAKVVQGDRSLVLSLTPPAGTTAQQPTSKPQVPEAVEPESQTQPEKTEPQGEDDVPQQPVETVQPDESAQGDEDIEILVTGEQEGYRVPDATTATKTDTPTRDIPANIQVIPQQILEDQGAVRIDEALRNVSGVNFSTSFGNRSPDFNVRGFTASQFRNGLLESSSSSFFNSRTAAETADLERIEVLKGPASVLFGQADLGGLINLVTKRPLPEPYYAVEFTAGSYDFYRPSLDFSGPLNSDGSLAYRLNVAYESAGSFRDFVESERLFIAPVLTWKIGSNTTLTIEGSYLHDERTFDRGLVAIGDRPADLPFNRALFDPAQSLAKFDEKRGYVYLDHKFNQNLSLRSIFRATTSYERWPDGQTQGGELEPDNRTLPLESYSFKQYYETYTLQNELIGKFNTGAIGHTVLLGLELAKQTGAFPGGGIASGASIDIFDPVYEFSFDPFEFSPGSNSEANTIGFYLQDQITLLDNLKLVVGGRFDSFDYEENYRDGSDDNVSEASELSPRLGIVYQPSETVSLYANYSRAFNPQFGRSANREPFEPERGKQYEVGVKADFLDRRLSSTLAAYEITKSNVLTEDPENPTFSIQVGEQRSRGIELDVAGEILPGWNVIASYAYTDAEITEDNTYEVGNRLNNVPYNTASLWTKYTIQKGSLEGLGFGAGIFYVDSRAGDLDNSFEIPDYTRIDAALYYEKDNFRAALNFKNLFDVKYYEGAQYRESIFPGAPFTVLGTISWEF